MTTLSRRAPLACAVAAGLALLAGCGATHAGAAATVGKTSISTADLRGIVDRGLADPQAAQQVGSNRDSYQRQQLSRLIDRALLEAVAKDEGVTVTDQQVDARIAQFAQQAGGRAQLDQQAAHNGVAPADLRPFVRDLVLENAVADKLMSDQKVSDADLRKAYQANIGQYQQIHVAHILVKDEATARTVLQQAKADPAAFGPLAAKYSIDTSNKDKGGDLGTNPRGTFVQEFEAAAYAAKPGSIIGPVKTQFGYHVIHVIDVKTTSFEQAKPSLVQQAQKQERQNRISDALRAKAKALGVSVNPRFGQWNPDKGSVDPLAGDKQLSSPGASSGGSPASPAAGAGQPSTGP